MLVDGAPGCRGSGGFVVSLMRRAEMRCVRGSQRVQARSPRVFKFVTKILGASRVPIPCVLRGQSKNEANIAPEWLPGDL